MKPYLAGLAYAKCSEAQKSLDAVVKELRWLLDAAHCEGDGNMGGEGRRVALALTSAEQGSLWLRDPVDTFMVSRHEEASHE